MITPVWLFIIYHCITNYLNLNGLKQQIFVTSWFLFLRNLNSILAEHVWLKLSARAAVFTWRVSFWGIHVPRITAHSACCVDFYVELTPERKLWLLQVSDERERDQDGSYSHCINQTWKWHPTISAILDCQKKISMSSQHSRGANYTRAWRPRCGGPWGAPFQAVCQTLLGHFRIEGIWQKHRRKEVRDSASHFVCHKPTKL